MMKIEVTKFKAEDYYEIDRYNPSGDGFTLNPEQIESLERTQEHLYTLKLDGRVIACGGAVERWKDRAEVFVVLDKEACRYTVTLLRVLKRITQILPYRRLEMTILRSYLQGHRLAQFLGFDMEAEVLRQFSPCGNDYSLFAKVKA